MVIEFHPQAIESFDRQGEALLRAVSAEPPPAAAAGWSPPVLVGATMEMGNGSCLDNTDLEKGKGFLAIVCPAGWVGLSGEAYVGLDRLTGSIHGVGEVNRVFDRKFL